MNKDLTEWMKLQEGISKTTASELTRLNNAVNSIEERVEAMSENEDTFAETVGELKEQVESHLGAHAENNAYEKLLALTKRVAALESAIALIGRPVMATLDYTTVDDILPEHAHRIEQPKRVVLPNGQWEHDETPDCQANGCTPVEQPEGSYICDDCGKDWGDGKGLVNDISEPVFPTIMREALYCFKSRNGCVALAVTWHPKQPAPEIKDLLWCEDCKAFVTGFHDSECSAVLIPANAIQQLYEKWRAE